MTRPQELLSAKQIQGRIGQIARDIERHYRDEPFVLLGVLKGSVIFLADLMREIRAPFDLEFLAARSYADGTTPEGAPVLTPFEAESLSDRHVLLVDDILDTGGTLVRVREWLLDQGALSVRTCVLLDKPARRQHDIKPDFFGFQIPDLFVVGYGMDHAGTWRQLPYIGRMPERPS